MTRDCLETTLDGFLGGRLQIRQPKQGYRAATDPVFLAASVRAVARQSVLELGCGVGVASLCLAHRVPGVDVTGVELQADYADLARENAASNGVQVDVITADLHRLPPDLTAHSFDHVLANPPFFDAGAVSDPSDAGKSTAHVTADTMESWIDTGLRRLKPGGSITVIQLTAQLPSILAGLRGRVGNIEVLPIASRVGLNAKRVLVSARKGAAGPMRLLPPFVVHDGAKHVQGRANYSATAQAVLRDGAPLNWD